MGGGGGSGGGAAGGGGGGGSGGGGAGGGAQGDAGPIDPNQPDAGTCLSASVEGMNALAPVDIIWVIDTSGSMTQERDLVQMKMNEFAANIGASGLDYHVIVIAGEICIPPPLAGPMCGDGPNFRWVRNTVGSHNGLEVVLQTYDLWRDFLRPDSVKTFVMVSDDNSSMSAADFDAQIRMKPEFANGYIFDAIVAYGNVLLFGCWTSFGMGAAVGQVYVELVNLTGGVSGVICEPDWNPIFMALEQSVMTGTRLPCTFAIPPPPPGEVLDTDKVNVKYSPPPPGAEVFFPRVDGVAARGAAGGWYYDDPSAPAEIILCPSSCTGLAGGGRINLEFGCETIVVGIQAPTDLLGSLSDTHN
jgi:hypothetical protein